MLTIRSYNNIEDESVTIEMEDGGIKFVLKSESLYNELVLASIYMNARINCVATSPSFPDMSETVVLDQSKPRSLQNMYDHLLSLAQGEQNASND